MRIKRDGERRGEKEEIGQKEEVGVIVGCKLNSGLEVRTRIDEDRMNGSCN